jgi:FkbM family methyltransferase
VTSLPARLAYRFVAGAPGAGRARTAGRLAPIFEAAFVAAGSPLLGQVVRVAHGPGAGLRIHAERRSLVWISGRVEDDVQETIQRLLPVGGCFVDVGASVGFFSLLAARIVGANGSVVAFEPQPEAARSARRNIALNGFDNATVVDAAVSSRDGVVTLEDVDKATAHVARADRPSRTGREVSSMTLDQFLLGRPEFEPDLVKIDVEGHELEVLEGMRESLLTRSPVVLIECHGDVTGALALLQEARYDVSVLGSDVSPIEAPPTAHLLALPPQRGISA